MVLVVVECIYFNPCAHCVFWWSLCRYVTSAVFSPNIPSVGASGAIFGLIGVAVVDLFQSWQLVEKPWSRVLTTFFHTVGYLMIGTLPFIDNWVRLPPPPPHLARSSVELPFGISRYAQALPTKTATSETPIRVYS
jgi:membrane associated rhomboid family serine protease